MADAISPIMASNRYLSCAAVWTLAVGCFIAACEADPANDQNSAGSGGQPIATLQEARSEKPRDTNPSVSDEALAQVVTGNTQLGFDLFHNLAKSDANHLSSPLSVSLALAMTYAGARGANEAEMASALHFTLPQSTQHSALNKLMLELGARNVPQNEAGTNEVLRLEVANAAWIRPDIQFVPAYLDTLAVEYGSGINLVDFRKDPVGAANLINAWVASKTEDRIKDLIPQGGISDSTAFVLTNALYFFGNWATPFPKSATFDAPFHTAAGDVTASMMEKTLNSRYAEGDGWKMADLSYTGGQVAMTIVLPDQGRLDEIRSAMSAGWLADSDSKAISSPVKFGLPKFRFTWGSASLVPSLKALGMLKAFEWGADFSGLSIGVPIRISEVFHQAFIAVDEDGTEAAAATAVVGEAGADSSAPDTPKSLYADRPFLFLIRDRTTGAVMFIGQVVDPSKS